MGCTEGGYKENKNWRKASGSDMYGQQQTENFRSPPPFLMKRVAKWFTLEQTDKVIFMGKLWLANNRKQSTDKGI